MILKLKNNKILLALIILVLFTAGCAQELTQQVALAETGSMEDVPENAEDMAAGRPTQYLYNQYFRMQNYHNSQGNLIVDLYASVTATVTSSTVVSWRLYKNGSYYKYLGSTLGKRYIRQELAQPIDEASYKVYALVDNPSSSDFIVCWSKTVDYKHDVKYRTRLTCNNKWYDWFYDGTPSNNYPEAVDSIQVDVLMNNITVYYQVSEGYKNNYPVWSPIASNGASCGSVDINSSQYPYGISPVEKIKIWLPSSSRSIRYKIWAPYAIEENGGWSDWFYDGEEASTGYNEWNPPQDDREKYIYAIEVEFIC